jgi:hypothetical protein
MAWNGTPGRGASTGIGFNAGSSGAHRRPAVLTVNDTPCPVA